MKPGFPFQSQSFQEFETLVLFNVEQEVKIENAKRERSPDLWIKLKEDEGLSKSFNSASRDVINNKDA